MRRFVFVGILAAFLSGCSGVKPLKPGVAKIQSGVTTNGIHQFVSEIRQPENPAQSAAQNFERTTETELSLAPGTKVIEKVALPDSAGRPVLTEKTIVLAEPTVQKTRTTE